MSGYCKYKHGNLDMVYVEISLDISLFRDLTLTKEVCVGSMCTLYSSIHRKSLLTKLRYALHS